jgi:hypothetical protein
MNSCVVPHMLGIASMILLAGAYEKASCFVSSNSCEAAVLEGNLHLWLMERTIVKPN